MKLKTTILSILALLFANDVFASMDRYVESPDLGLPDGETVGIGIAIGAVAFIIGFIILKATDKNDSSAVGCLTMLCFGVASVCFLPLLAWLYAIAASLWLIGVAVVAIAIIIALIISFFKK